MMLHKLRKATVRPGREKLYGKIEVDDTYVGGKEEDVVGRQVGTKTPVVVAVEVRGRASGRVRLRALPDVSAASLLPFIQETIVPGTVVCTDGWQGYARVASRGFHHRVRLMKAEANPSRVLPHVHRAISNLKSAPRYPKPEKHTLAGSEKILLTYHGQVELPLTLEVAAGVDVGPRTLKGTVRYQACDRRSCRSPKSMSFTLDLRVTAGKTR